MFGLENQKKKKKIEPFVFDLEKAWKEASKQQETKDLIEARIQKIKKVLQQGENKGEFDEFGTLLHGYTSLLKVMARCNAK